MGFMGEGAPLQGTLFAVPTLRAGAVELGSVCCDSGLRRLARQVEAGRLGWNDLRQPRWYEMALMLAAWIPVKTTEYIDWCRPLWMPPWQVLTWYVECAFEKLLADMRMHPYVRRRLYPAERYALVVPYVGRTEALRLSERANECACGDTHAYTAVLFDHEPGANTPGGVEWMCESCAAQVDRRARVLPLAGEWDRVFGKYGSRMVESQLDVGRGRGTFNRRIHVRPPRVEAETLPAFYLQGEECRFGGRA